MITSQVAFNGGVLSPQVWGRTDFGKRATGCRTMLNAIPLVHGPATSRTGTQYIDDAIDTTRTSRMEDFAFSSDPDQALGIEFGHLKIAFIKNGGRVLNGGSAYSITSPYSEDDLEGLDLTQSGDTVFIAHQNYEPRKLVRTADDNWTLSVIEFDWPPFAASNTQEDLRIWSEIVHQAGYTMTVYANNPIFEDYHVGAYLKFSEIVELRYDEWEASTSYTNLSSFVQYDGNAYQCYRSGTSGTRPPVHTQGFEEDGGVKWLFLNSGSGFGKITSRTGAAEVEMLVIKDIPRSISDNFTITNVSNSNPCVITAENHLKDGEAVVIDDVVGTGSGTSLAATFNGGQFIVSNVTTSSFTVAVDTTAHQAYASGGFVSLGTFRWSVSSWTEVNSWSEGRGYPGAVCFHQDRLCWAGSPEEPQTIWCSKTGLYYDHSTSTPLQDDDALQLTLGARRLNAIQWIQSIKSLTVGTSGAEWWLSSATGGESAITANSKQATTGSYNGSSPFPPVPVGNAVLYLGAHGKTLRELTYSWESSNFVGNELTILAEHLTREETITYMAFQKEPHQVLWCIRTDGKLLSITYNRNQDVWAWALHKTGDQDKFESLTVIPGYGEDELLLCVKRYVNGSWKRYIERLAYSFTSDDPSDAFYVDSGLTLDNRQEVEAVEYTAAGKITITNHGYSTYDNILFRSIDLDLPDEEDHESFNLKQFQVKYVDVNRFSLTYFGMDVDLTNYKQTETLTAAKKVWSVSGLDHLEGKTVQILSDGNVLAEQVVSSGTVIGLAGGGSVVHVGLGFDSDIETLSWEIPTRSGTTSQADIKRIVSTMLKVYKTKGGQIGASEADLKDITYEESDTLTTGDTKVMAYPGSKHRRQQRIFIRQSDPLPLTVLSITAEMED